MGAISSAIGLITGFPIQETVSKLVSLDAGPMDQLQSQDTTLQAAADRLHHAQRGPAGTRKHDEWLRFVQSLHRSNPDEQQFQTP